MTTIQKNVLWVVDAMLFLKHPPCWSSGAWIRLISTVARGELYVMTSRDRLYPLLKLEPEVCRKLLPFLILTARQGETLSGIHSNPAELAERRAKGRLLY